MNRKNHFQVLCLTLFFSLTLLPSLVAQNPITPITNSQYLQIDPDIDGD